MAHKFGDAYVNDMVDRGRRELGGVMYPDSNIAQPMYPLRGTYGPPKQLDGPESTDKEASLDNIHPTEISRDDLGKDDRDPGMERD
jgi:hypothetical protein